MIKEEDRILAGAAIVLSASLSALNQTDPALASRSIFLINEGMKMMGSEARVIVNGKVSDFLLPAAELLFGRFAPVESVMEG